jgi:hypothetical protein
LNLRQLAAKQLGEGPGDSFFLGAQ